MNAEKRQVWIDKLFVLPALVEAAIAGLNDEQLDTPYRVGGWTVRQVVHHIADSHLHGYMRMKVTVVEDHPTVKLYEQDDWADVADAKDISVGPSLLLLRGLMERWGIFLSNLSESDWSRTVHNPETGEVTLAGLLKLYAWHGAHHVEQITELRKERGW